MSFKKLIGIALAGGLVYMLGKRVYSSLSEAELCEESPESIPVSYDEVMTRAIFTEEKGEAIDISSKTVKIIPSFDKIVAEFPAYATSYIPPSKILDYRKVGNVKTITNPHNLYMPTSDVWNFKNKSGNPMQIVLMHLTRDKKPYHKYKIQVHSETEFLTLDRVEQISSEVYAQYLEQTERMDTPEPHPSVVEVALDHLECDPYFFYIANQNHLFKRYYRERVEYSDAKGKPKLKGIGERRYRLFPEFQTCYIGGRSSSIHAACYLMFPVFGGDPVYRLEMRLGEDFFKREGLSKISDLSLLRLADIWSENFSHVKLDAPKIAELTRDLSISGHINGMVAMSIDAPYTVADSSFPTQLDVYDILKRIPKNDTDWLEVYNALPDTVQKEFDDLRIAPQKGEPKALKDIYRNLKLEKYTDIPYDDIKDRLFVPAAQLLMGAPEFDAYNETIIGSLNKLIRQTPLPYRIQQAMNRVNGEENQNNITEIARLAHTTWREVKEYHTALPIEN